MAEALNIIKRAGTKIYLVPKDFEIIESDLVAASVTQLASFARELLVWDAPQRPKLAANLAVAFHTATEGRLEDNDDLFDDGPDLEEKRPSSRGTG